MRTHLSDLQRSIQRKICPNGRKRLGMVLFHCRRQFPKVRTTELFMDMLAPLVSSGGSALSPHSANVAGPSRRAIQAEPEAQLVASPTFGIYNETEAGDLVADLGDTVTGALQALCAPLVQREPDPSV
ncbi:hypothetical protein PIB30_022180 [Stylosanthes scabra]|uniref:Uncharacterized protein n=1 Tax=Stylosanthes scabra TaxID=79078 RepID=A0ABU6W724_9FABA|nr:hypothetical protein [Stylosanthes scabra]